MTPFEFRSLSIIHNINLQFFVYFMIHKHVCVQVCVLENDKPIVDLSAGRQSPYDGKLVGPDTIFNCFSVTKGVAAGAVHILAERYKKGKEYCLDSLFFDDLRFYHNVYYLLSFFLLLFSSFTLICCPAKNVQYVCSHLYTCLKRCHVISRIPL